ncbi:uncharacterized protein SPPG_05784 [Spizellomyces punctatus DAOM BR117]|uniref:NAD(P)-binding domain-containing protein n=1 Tax=Spizellomyces punctatus (strain DAOM BR117) TaxID=645134 RepID=A0A0L0HCU3_SPIPD|nr:uncharacterized protein SPPG_05784 [Spizellomyces punctatus DAOM BR117]KNC98806.1 hypothetical protein SPPG_05784 [Spizellomyces punctatus DAOM BR117]|eukprot:XP_016606846.1 hypothetical protein SPPG_05784 [Spizellomyces punctatus DAOM BR117]
MRVLVVGGTGNVGKLLLQQLLERGVEVRAIVRSPESIPATISGNPKLSLIEASLLDISEDELITHIRGCDAVMSTLGHNMHLGSIPFLGIWAAPHDLVLRASKNLCGAIEKIRPETPIKFILLNTVGVTNPAGTDVGVRSRTERAIFWTLEALIPPHKDNVRAAEYINKEIGTGNQFIEWTAVRPDAFIDGDVSEYTTHESIQHSLFDVNDTTKANIAHFMAELATNPETWATWKGKMPVIIDAKQKKQHQ